MYAPAAREPVAVTYRSKWCATFTRNTLLPGARYVHPDDKDIGKYVYPDWRERMNWRKSVEYGTDKR